jgi:putative phosphoribosyl transferase
MPGREEVAMGAIASGGVRVLNDYVVNVLPRAELAIAQATEKEMRELRRREAEYRPGRTVILVDDGLATGATMRAAVQALREQKAAAIIVAVPVAAPDTCEEFKHLADEVVCATTPESFQAVGQFYEDFTQTTDDEVRQLLARAMERSGE